MVVQEFGKSKTNLKNEVFYLKFIFKALFDEKNVTFEYNLTKKSVYNVYPKENLYH